jgi:alcohol dehydrogenase class IV
MAVNVRALQQRAPESEALRRYDEIARILTRNERATADDGVVWVRELCQALQVPSLASYGVTEEDFLLLIEKASVSSSMKGNPIVLTTDEMGEILKQAL